MKNKSLKVALISASLILCVGVTMLTNSALKNAKVDVASRYLRGPASQLLYDLRSGTVAVERKLASSLAVVRERTMASIGRPVDPLENFRFGVLEGKYALTMRGDKISDISFVDNPETLGSPAVIPDRIRFLKQYGALMDAKENPERVRVDARGQKIIETYRIRDGITGQETYVKIELDDTDHLFTLRAEKVNNLKIF